MSDHKRVWLPKAFSPSGLSGSNIHLAWCIPGLETLMWFVGKSRWQVHGSTLLPDSAGASGRLHNNTDCLSAPPTPRSLPPRDPPPFPYLYNYTAYPSSTNAHIYCLFYIGALVLKNWRRNHLRVWHSAQLYWSCNLLYFTLLCSLCFCPFSSFASLFASHSVFVHIFYCLTSL